MKAARKAAWPSSAHDSAGRHRAAVLRTQRVPRSVAQPQWMPPVLCITAGLPACSCTRRNSKQRAVQRWLTWQQNHWKFGASNASRLSALPVAFSWQPTCVPLSRQQSHWMKVLGPQPEWKASEPQWMHSSLALQVSRAAAGLPIGAGLGSFTVLARDWLYYVK